MRIHIYCISLPSGRIAGAYRINGKSYNNNNRRKVSLREKTFIITNKWRSDNGFQQLTLVYNSRPMKFSRDSRRCIRRALCKDKDGAFILQSNYPMKMSTFAYYHIQKCHQATRCLRMQSREGCWVNTRKHYERTETIDEHKQDCGQQSSTEIFDLPDILDCLNKLTHTN